VYLSTEDLMFNSVAYWMIVAGIVGGLLAAPFGFIDWVGIPPATRAKRIGAVHGIGNVVIVLLFIASVLLRGDALAVPATGAYVCSFLGLGMALITGWLGGELVNQLGIGVNERAHVDAPSSMRKATRPS
jgi:uncharacterized membrane protein